MSNHSPKVNDAAPAHRVSRWSWLDVDGRAMVIVLVLVYLFVLVRTAWVSDDAYITFRTIDNFVNGYGLCWNIAERVQSFTHPLWLLVVALFYLISKEAFFTSIILSVAISLTAVALMVERVAQSRRTALVAVSVLILSKAFTDYSTSGLESPLTHLLLVLFAIVLIRREHDRRSLFLLSLLAALGTLNRMDTVLLYLPALIYAWYQLRSFRSCGMILLGFVPLWLWEAFSLFYYGSLLPNTAFAKLGTGIPLGERLAQGLAYLLNSLSVDPLTLLVVAAASILAFVRKLPAERLVISGGLLYLVYIVFVGGDFMTGRFLTPVLLIGVIVVARMPVPQNRLALVAPFGVVLAVGLSAPHCPLYCGADYGLDLCRSSDIERNSGIADERGCYFSTSGLLNWRRGHPMPSHPRVAIGKAWSTGDSGRVMIAGAVGFVGFYAGPDIHIIDVPALNDPLLARLPAAPNRWWRIGHHDRAIPAGYPETHESGENQLVDSNLARYYDRIRLVTRGPLFSWSRLKTIVRLNLGGFDHLLPSNTPPLHLQRHQVATRVPPGTPQGGEGTIWLTSAGAQIDLGEVVHVDRLEMTLDHNDDYRLVFVNGSWPIDSLVIPAAQTADSGMAPHLIDVPSEVSSVGFDGLRIYPDKGDDNYWLGHISLEREADSMPSPSR